MARGVTSVETVASRQETTRTTAPTPMSGPRPKRSAMRPEKMENAYIPNTCDDITAAMLERSWWWCDMCSEVITISMDNPKDEAKALKFLQSQHAGMPARIAATLKGEGRTTNNYIYTQASADAFVQALDPTWPGPIPHTILVAPGGEIIWRFNGAFDPVVLGRKILDRLGGFYPVE